LREACSDAEALKTPRTVLVLPTSTTRSIQNLRGITTENTKEHREKNKFLQVKLLKNI